MRTDRKVGLALIAASLLLMVLIGYVKAGIDQRDVLLCEAVANNPNMEMSECPAHQSNTSWVLMTAFGFTFLILGLGAYLILKRPDVKKKKYKEVDFSKLDEEEKKIYELLKENKGSVYQSDIIKQTEMSKVKVSRKLDKMVTRGIIDKKRRGMTNLIVLK